MNTRVVGAGCWVLSAGCLLGAAQVTAGRTETQSGAKGIAAAVVEVGNRYAAAWVGYRVPIVAGRRTLCFDQARTYRGDPDDLRPAGPEPTELMVLARLEHGRVSRVRTFTPDCSVDAGATPIVWLTDVNGGDSAAWLASLVDRPSDDSSRLLDAALLALSLHADPAGITRLIAIAREHERARVRGQALFWLAERAGDRAIGTISGAVDNDPDVEVKKKAVFALSQLPKDEGVPKLIDVARGNRNPAVRKQAMFWLGQSNDPRAVRFFEEILGR